MLSFLSCDTCQNFFHIYACATSGEVRARELFSPKILSQVSNLKDDQPTTTVQYVYCTTVYVPAVAAVCVCVWRSRDKHSRYSKPCRHVGSWSGPGRTKLTRRLVSVRDAPVRRTAKKAWRTDAAIPAEAAPHEGLDLSADGVLRKPAARALANEKFEGVDDQQFLQKWLDTVGGKLPETRTVAVRLTPMRENVGSLASYTEEELMKGFVEQDEDVPPFVVRGKLANNGKGGSTVSHIAAKT